MSIKLLVVLVFLIIYVQCNFLQQRGAGGWSGLMNPNSDVPNLPSRYFMCGFQFKTTKFHHSWRCHCRKRWYRWRRRWRCRTCGGWYDTRTSALKIKFCHYSDWSKQKEDTYDIRNDPHKGAWGPLTMCPFGQFANQATVTFGNFGGHDLGMNGLALKCQPLNNGRQVQQTWTKGGSWTPWSGKLYGNFFSSAKVKGIPRGYLNGLQLISSPAPEITRIDFDYKIPTGLNYVPYLLGENIIDNKAPIMVQKTVVGKHQFKRNYTYRISNSTIREYFVSGSMKFSLPFVNPSIRASTRVSKTQTFAFQNKFEEVFTHEDKILLFVPKFSKIVLKQVAYITSTSVPFNAVVYFANRANGQIISTARVSGTWEGVLAKRFSDEINLVPQTQSSGNSIDKKNNN